MAEITVPTSWVADGALGLLCARHGTPRTADQKRTFFTTTPPWSYVFILAGFLPFLIVLVAMRRQVKGTVPVCASCHTGRRVYVGAVTGLWLVVVACFAASLATASDALFGVSGLLLVVALLSALVGDQLRVRGALARDQQSVRLTGVSPAFAQGAQAALQAPPVARPARQLASPIQQSAGTTLLPRR